MAAPPIVVFPCAAVAVVVRFGGPALVLDTRPLLGDVPPSSTPGRRRPGALFAEGGAPSREIGTNIGSDRTALEART